MSGWNEDNFLEELLPPLRHRLAAGLCPEAETWCAVADDEASESLRNAIAAHTARCPACRDLQQRLQRFDGPVLPGHENEWEQTEERLESWLKSFLRSGAAVDRAGRRAQGSHPGHWWQGLAIPPFGWRMRWVLVPAATLAVVIGSFLAGRLSAPRSPQLTASATPYTTPSLERTPDREPQLPEAAPQTEPDSAAGTAIASRAARRTSPPVASPAAPAESVPASDVAALAPPAPGNPGQAPISPPAQAVPSPTDERAVETAATSGPAPSATPAGRGVLSSRRATPSGITSTVVSRGVTPAPAARAERSPAVPAPQTIRLDAGTRVWITLKSVHPRADGASEFRGAVLLPVTQSGAVLIGRNSEVSGVMSVRNGKRSVQILEFLSTGAHYRLRGASGEANLRLLGAGQALEFDAGKVLETWMASASTYEKVPGEPRPPE